jgi:hypothetical protein
MTATLAITVLVTTRAWNPLPLLEDFWHNLTRMSDPEPRWQVRIDGRPDAVGVYDSRAGSDGGRMVVATRGWVEGFRTQRNQSVWKRDAYWALPARTVVFAQLRPEDPDANPEPERGYSAIDPYNGSVVWTDRDAEAVWVFATHIVGLHCPDQDLCVLRNRDDRGTLLWELNLPGRLRAVHGQNPHRPGLRSPAGWFADAAVGVPPPLPLILPLVIDDQIYIVDTGAARLVDRISIPDRQTRVAFFGDRKVLARVERAPAGCRYTAEVFEVGSGASVWQRSGYDLDTARGAGCEPREDPLGAGSRFVVNGTDDRPMLVEAGGAEPFPVWTGPTGARVLATDGWLAVVVEPDRQTVSLLDVTTLEPRTVWTGQFGLDPDAALAGNLLIIRDRDGGRLVALRLPTMRPRPTWPGPETRRSCCAAAAPSASSRCRSPRSQSTMDRWATTAR